MIVREDRTERNNFAAVAVWTVGGTWSQKRSHVQGNRDHLYCTISTVSSRILKICWPRWPINFLLSSSDLKQGLFFWPLMRPHTLWPRILDTPWTPVIFPSIFRRISDRYSIISIFSGLSQLLDV